MSKTLRIPPDLGVVEFKLAGMTCYRWFDEHGVLCAASPPKGKKAIKSYLDEFSPLMADPEIVDLAISSEPAGEGNLPIKLHAILDLVREDPDWQGDDAEIAISSEQVEAKVKELELKKRKK